MAEPDPAGRPAQGATSEDLRAEVREAVAAWRISHPGAARSDAWLRGFAPEFSADLARRGLIGITWPQRFGGAERANTDRLAVTEELLRAAAPVAAHWIGDRQIGPAILRNGSPELQEEILPLITSARAVFCLGMSEPEAGSDLAAVRTRAEAVPGGFRVRGRKIWTSHAHRATHMYLLARTADAGARKHEGLSEFIVDMDSTGITVSPIPDLTGEHHFNEVLLEDVLVPARRVIGKLGDGWRQVTEQLSFERGGAERVLSTYPVFMSLLDVAASCPPAGPAASELVGSLVARLAVLRQLAYQVALEMDAGTAPVQAAAVLKYLGTAFETDVVEAYRRLVPVADAAVGGGFGQALLASPGFGLRGGAAEVLLGIIARQVLR
jgi:alkylation response protein AidB-like acyl-CoA dehydrogenase